MITSERREIKGFTETLCPRSCSSEALHSEDASQPELALRRWEALQEICRHGIRSKRVDCKDGGGPGQPLPRAGGLVGAQGGADQAKQQLQGMPCEKRWHRPPPRPLCNVDCGWGGIGAAGSEHTGRVCLLNLPLSTCSEARRHFFK